VPEFDISRLTPLERAAVLARMLVDGGRILRCRPLNNWRSRSSQSAHGLAQRDGASGRRVGRRADADVNVRRARPCIILWKSDGCDYGCSQPPPVL
jgi:hypothetical protein